MEDQQIIGLFFERSQQAIAELSEKYGRLCRSLSYRILNDEQDAEECVDDAYLAVWDTIPPQKPDSLSAYVCRITRNLSLKRYRKNNAQKRSSAYEQSLDELSDCMADGANIENRLDEKELTESINQFLKGIKPIDRVMFVQRYWLCLELSEIAEKLRKPKNYINVHLHRTRVKLKEYLSKEGYL